jgi:hypothetical protein
MQQTIASLPIDAFGNGRTKRYVIHTNLVRTVRLSNDELQTIRALQATLCGHEPGDVVSMSLVLRRAVKIYSLFINSLDPHKLAVEKVEMRKHNSRMPRASKS